MNTTERIVLHCAKCGAQNPIVAEYCHKCGAQLHAARKSETEAQAGISGQVVPQGNPSPSVAQAGADSKWAAAYGWLMVVSGLCLLFVGIVTFLVRRDNVSSAAAKANPTGMIFAVALGLLCAATGIVIVTKNRAAARRP
jgi:ribosomal protein L40E